MKKVFGKQMIFTVSDAGPCCEITNGSLWSLESVLKEGWVIKHFMGYGKNELMFLLERDVSKNEKPKKRWFFL